MKWLRAPYQEIEDRAASSTFSCNAIGRRHFNVLQPRMGVALNRNFRVVQNVSLNGHPILSCLESSTASYGSSICELILWWALIHLVSSTPKKLTCNQDARFHRRPYRAPACWPRSRGNFKGCHLVTWVFIGNRNQHLDFLPNGLLTVLMVKLGLLQYRVSRLPFSYTRKTLKTHFFGIPGYPGTPSSSWFQTQDRTWRCWRNETTAACREPCLVQGGALWPRHGALNLARQNSHLATNNAAAKPFGQKGPFKKSHLTLRFILFFGLLLPILWTI